MIWGRRGTLRPRFFMHGACAGALALAATAACAEESDFCPERPGQTTPPCVMDPGRVMLETAAVSWTYDDHGGAQSDAVLIGASTVRVGLARRLEAQVGWTPVGWVRVRDKLTGLATTRSGVGDVSLGLLYGLAGQSGPVSLQAFVTAPTGTGPIGAGDWSAGARLPIAFPVAPRVQLAVTPEVDAEVNGDGAGRHLAYGGAFGLGYSLSKTVGLGADIAVLRHEESPGPTTSASAGLSLAWQAGRNTQLDVGATLGLNRDTANRQLYVGIAHRF
jgi:hypothetical protein